MPVTIRSTAASAVWLVVLATFATLHAAPPAAAAPREAFIRDVRAFELDDLSIDSPAGIAYSPTAEAFHVIEAAAPHQRAPGRTTIVTVTPNERRLRATRIAAQISDPINVAFDQRRQRLLAYAPAADRLIEVDESSGALDPSTLERHGAQRLGIDDPQGMATDPDTGQIYILDSAAARIVRVTPSRTGDLDTVDIADIDLGSSGIGDAVGLALDPTTGHLHVVDAIEEVLYELTPTGAVIATRDLSGLELVDPQGIVFAESGDLTDDADQLSLYLADSGVASDTGERPPVVSDVAPTSHDTGADPSTPVAQATTTDGTGQLLELSFTDVPAAPTAGATASASTLVQTIEAFNWSPPSPDTSGVVYLPESNTLLASDGEVNEMPLYAGANMFEASLSGNLVDTFTTLDFDNNEPTGVTVNPADGHLFISQDTPPKQVHELDPGADGSYGTADDAVTTFGTTDFSSTDPEGVTYAPELDALFVADGLNNEVYHLAPGANGTFDGVAPSGDDQLVGQFDTLGLGLEDPEGIAYNRRTGSLYLGGKTRNIGTYNFDTLLEVSTDGALIRTIDVSDANPDRQITRQKLSGLAFGPSSQDASSQAMYIADRGEDNNSDPEENDGRIYEMTVPGTSGSGVGPVAVDDAAVTQAGSAVVVDVAANDSDADGDLDAASANSACANGSSGCAGASDGSLIDNGDGTITYTPDTGFVGADSFVYEICDTTARCDTATVTVTVDDPDDPGNPGGSGDGELVSFDINTTVPGVGGVRDEDIVSYDAAAGTWALYFDASDVGITSNDIDAFHVRGDGSVLLSFSSTMTVPGLTGGPAGESVEDADVVLFTPTSTGATTAGSFSFHFDGSDVELDTSGEDITGLYEFADGSLGVTTAGTISVSGVAKGGDEDVHRFSGSFGAATSGAWSLLFDGSDLGLTGSGDDLDGVAFDGGSDLLFSTKGSYAAAGGAGDDEDISRFTGTLGPTTSGSITLERDLSALGIDPAADVDALHLGR
ncbi:MAG TPA: Ig-like domain-containing protein [Euzebyales bacterium]